MGWFGHAAKRVAKPIRRVGRVVRALWDAAQTTDENKNHWSMADGYSADSAANPAARRTVRNRARYEACNNSWLAGIVATKINDVIGTGPHLELETEDEEANEKIEGVFREWAKEVRLAQKLRTCRAKRLIDGEVFIVLTTNPKLRSPIKLDLKLIEAEQVTTPNLSILQPNAVDGIDLDEYGNPVTYHILKHHPGDTLAWKNGWETDPVPASDVIHYYHLDRPGQNRGVSEIMPALSLFALMRRYTLATVRAAEQFAELPMAIYTDQPPGDPDAATPEAMDTFEIERGMATVLPESYKPFMPTPSQPTTTYPTFIDCLLNEIVRCINMPLNIAKGNSGGYNLASSRLDRHLWVRSVDVDREEIENIVLDRLFDAWMREAVLVSDLLPIPMRTQIAQGEQVPHAYFWDGFEDADPVKDTSGTDTQLKNNTTTLAIQWAKRGIPWRNALSQIAKEQAYAKSLGVSLVGMTASAPAQPAPASNSPMPGDKSAVVDDNDKEDAAADE